MIARFSMKSMSRWPSAMALGACLASSGGSGAEPQVVIAQTRAPIMVTRIYTAADGLAYAEEIEMPRTASGRYEMLSVTGAQFSSRPPSNGGGWHTGPKRQYVITLRGRAELELSGGQKVQVGPGQINLIEDTTGKGHITRNLGPEDRIVITVVLEDQILKGGPAR
jgi:quercetin dioxygenase-like cupin family protein